MLAVTVCNGIHSNIDIFEYPNVGVGPFFQTHDIPIRSLFWILVSRFPTNHMSDRSWIHFLG